MGIYWKYIQENKETCSKTVFGMELPHKVTRRSGDFKSRGEQMAVLKREDLEKTDGRSSGMQQKRRIVEILMFHLETNEFGDGQE
jgi:hypothetical protein